MMHRDELVARTIHKALFPNMPWEEQLDEVRAEMGHAARRAIHVLTLQRALPSPQELLRAMWEDVSSDPHNLAVVMPRNLFDYCMAELGLDYSPEMQIHIPPFTAEELQLEAEVEVRPKGIVRRWLERMSTPWQDNMRHG